MLPKKEGKKKVISLGGSIYSTEIGRINKSRLSLSPESLLLKSYQLTTAPSPPSVPTHWARSPFHRDPASPGSLRRLSRSHKAMAGASPTSPRLSRARPWNSAMGPPSLLTPSPAPDSAAWEPTASGWEEHSLRCGYRQVTLTVLTCHTGISLRSHTCAAHVQLLSM